MLNRRSLIASGAIGAAAVTLTSGAALARSGHRCID